MASDPLSRDKFVRPEQFLSELLRKGAQGRFREITENTPTIFRAVVVAVDVKGGKLENPDGQGKVEHDLNGKKFDVPATVGPKNPRNSVKARLITDGLDQFVHDDELRVFWPLMPEHSQIPIKPGEYVYVMFEDEEMEHGLWISKVPGHEGLNLRKGQKELKDPGANALSNKFDDTQGLNSSEEKLDSDKSATKSKPDGNLKNLFD